MEETLNKVIKYMQPGQKNLIVSSGRGSRLHTDFNPPLEFNSSDVGYEMCLIRLETYFSFPNVDKTNNSIRISISDKWYDIKIPTGCYDIDSINNVIQRELIEVGGEKKVNKYLLISANKNTLSCV